MKAFRKRLDGTEEKSVQHEVQIRRILAKIKRFESPPLTFIDRVINHRSNLSFTMGGEKRFSFKESQPFHFPNDSSFAS
jgi:hypothetical protein